MARSDRPPRDPPPPGHRARQAVDPRTVRPPSSPSGVTPPRGGYRSVAGPSTRTPPPGPSPIQSRRVDHPYVPTEPIDVEIVEPPSKPVRIDHAESSAALTIPRPAKSALKIATFIVFAILGAGVWGWGAFATFLFAVAATGLIAHWIEALETT